VPDQDNSHSEPIVNWRLGHLCAVIEEWARLSPNKPAMIQHEDGRVVTYKGFARLIDFFALRLLDAGIKRGDRVATQLPTLPEHFALMYACFAVGAIAAPLDLRLQNDEVTRDLAKIEPKAFFFLGETPVRNFREVGTAVRQACPYIDHLVQFTPGAKGETLADGAVSITDFMAKGRLILLKLGNLFTKRLAKARDGARPTDPALIIYTTGTTGEPKPAVLSHENILVQNEVLRRGVGLAGDTSILVNLPPSHVAGTSEAPMTTWYVGGTAVLLRIFDIRMSLEAVQRHQVTVLGQIPTQFRMEWALPDYDQFDLSSLEYAIYAGSAVDEAFLERLAQMAPRFGTGLGMTESAGFVTFTPPGISVAEMAGQVGTLFEDLAKVTVREPMAEDGTAGDEVDDGTVGEICYHPPIVFVGYYNNPEATARAVSEEGILYTGDLGYFEDKGSYRALYLAGRQKFVIKQKGYQVFPDEVQAHIAALPGVDVAEVVGVPHELFDEGIFAFVKPEPGAELTPEAVHEHCKQIAAYKRPQHVDIWPPDEPLPLTRVAKVDKLVLRERALALIEQLRDEGKWDR
jgi:acyl-CoA synthetase (AMP-forming)/AMP-acid ligase II